MAEKTRLNKKFRLARSIKGFFFIDNFQIYLFNKVNMDDFNYSNFKSNEKYVTCALYQLLCSFLMYFLLLKII